MLLNQLAQFVPNFRMRAGQQALVQAIESAFLAEEILVAEAGTGTGKTFSYLVAALPLVLTQNKRLIVSTNTVALQSQLVKKDLPVIKCLAKELAEKPLSIEIAKGGERYFCPNRARQLMHSQTKQEDKLRQTELDLDDDDLDINHANISGQHIDVVTALLHRFDTQVFDGDLDNLVVEQEKDISPLVQRHRERCTRKLCDFFERCPYYLQRAKLKDADIIVTNHALLSIVCQNNFDTFGELDNALLVLDEAHHFAEVYRDQSVATIELNGEYPDKLAESFSKAVVKLFSKLTAHDLKDIDSEQAHKIIEKIGKLAYELTDECIHLDTFLQQNFTTLRAENSSKFGNESQWLIGFSLVPDPLLVFLQNIFTLCDSLLGLTARLDKQLFKPLESEKLILTKNKKLFSRIAMRNQKLEQTLANMQRCSKYYLDYNEIPQLHDRVQAGIVRWIETGVDQKQNRLITLSANRFDISVSLASNVFDKFLSTIFTSATLRALGSFKRFNQGLGLHSRNDVRTLTFDSPFDYSRVSLRTPIMFGDPNLDSYSEKIAKEVHFAAQRHQAILVLFSSYAQMHRVFNLCSLELRRLIIRQSAKNRGELVSQHCQRIEQGQTSILFGVDSLAEGVDLKGKYLTCVMIAKFPFEHLGQPMLDFEVRVLKYQGRSDFNEISLPLCSRKLIQAVGRLIRTEDDYGEVVILDSRYHTKPSYGKALVHTLPFFQALD